MLPAGQPLLYVYPVLLAVEFYAHIITFQVGSGWWAATAAVVGYRI
jgi:hypothetical protein